MTNHSDPNGGDDSDILSLSSNFLAEIIDGDEGFESICREWQLLADEVEGAPWTCQPQVYRTWTKLIRTNGRTNIISVRNGNGQLRGIMPIMQDLTWRGPTCAPRFDYDPRDRSLIASRRPRPLPVRQLATMGSLPATMLWIGALVIAEDSEPVCHAMAKAILSIRKWDVAIIPTVEGLDQQRWLKAFETGGAKAFTQILGRNVQDIRKLDAFGTIVARQKKKFRQNVRRAVAAADTAGITFSVHVGAQEMQTHKGEIAEIARSSWKHQGRAGSDVHLRYDGDQRSFFEHLFAMENLGCEPVLGMARDADGPIAVQIMLRHGNAITALLTFWNGRQSRASPGLLLMGETIDWAVSQNIERFDFNATATWVRYLTDSQKTLCNIVVFSPGMRGKFYSKISTLAGKLT